MSLSCLVLHLRFTPQDFKGFDFKFKSRPVCVDNKITSKTSRKEEQAAGVLSVLAEEQDPAQ